MLTRAAAADLPPPSRDDLGDNVRILEWDPPLPIAGLSRRAQGIISHAATARPGASRATEAAYVERAERVRDFLHSVDVAALLGIRPTHDLLRQLPGELSWPGLAFDQHFVYPDGTPARVDAGRVSVLFGSDGISISLLVSTFQPDLEPSPVNVSSDQAAIVALEATADLGMLELVDGVPPELVVLRKPFPFAGVRPARVVRRANDRASYWVRLMDTERPTRTWLVPVEPETGEAGLPKLMRSDGPDPTPYTPPDAWQMQASVGFLELWAKVGMCWAYEGKGKDTYGMDRKFSTTLFPENAAPDASKPWAMMSCNESWQREVKFGDLMAFESNPITFEPAGHVTKLFFDDDDDWVDSPSVPHAVNSQFWGERVIRYFKQHGYTQRATGDPIRFLTWYRPLTSKNDYAELTASPLGWISPPFKGNGLIDIRGPGLVFTTSADPAVLMHEFSHSLAFDTGGLADVTTEDYAVQEGLADCFAMIGLDAFQREAATSGSLLNDLPPQYVTLGAEAPFHLWAGSYKDPSHVTKGFPNLANPWDGYGPVESKSGDYADQVIYKYWNGQGAWPALDQKSNELNSTLLGGVCKLLVTGGGQPHLDQSKIQTFGGGASDALGYFNVGGVDRDTGYDRLGRLLLFTFVMAKLRPTTFYDLVDVLATYVEKLAASEWSAQTFQLQHRLRRTFAEYGFGRIKEVEPNHSNDIWFGNFTENAKRNLLAAGKRAFHPIEGGLCNKDIKDEDVFPINERVEQGDKIKFTLAATTSKPGDPPPVIEVRFYGGSRPCPFEDPGCSKAHQVYPTTDGDGNTPTSNASLPTDVFPFPDAPGPGPGGGGDPWSNPGHQRLFVGVRLKEGPCDTTYTLQVEIERGKDIYP